MRVNYVSVVKAIILLTLTVKLIRDIQNVMKIRVEWGFTSPLDNAING